MRTPRATGCTVTSVFPLDFAFAGLALAACDVPPDAEIVEVRHVIDQGTPLLGRPVEQTGWLSAF